MQAILKSVFGSWITSIFGGVAGIPMMYLAATATPFDIWMFIAGLGAFLTGLAAKQGNVTGGAK